MIFSASADGFYSKDFHLKCLPMCVNVEDTLFYKLQDYVRVFLPDSGTSNQHMASKDIPEAVILATESTSQLIYFNKITVEEISLQEKFMAGFRVQNFSHNS